MKRITKREYQDRKAQIERQMDEAKAALARMADNYANIPYFQLSTEVSDMWDRLNDELDSELPDALRALESEWARRNWTYQDYQHAALVAANVD